MRQFIYVILSLILINGCTRVTPDPKPASSDPNQVALTPDPNNSTEKGDPAPPEPIMIDIRGSIGTPHIRLEGFPSEIQTGTDGCYQAQVPSGWSGTVAPVDAGLRFNPPQRTYQDINSPALHEDYQSMAQEVVIVGSIDLPGVSLLGAPNLVRTDEQGHFRLTVPHGWSGQLVPSRPGIRFTPAFRDYDNLKQSLSDQDFLTVMETAPVLVPAASPVASTATPALVSPPAIPAIPALTTPILLWRDQAPPHADELREDLLTLGAILMDEVLDRSSLVCPNPRTDRLFPQGVYLEGFGVLFTLRLDTAFPLLVPTEPYTEDDPSATADPTASVWNRTRERLFAEQTSAADSSATQRLNQAYLERLISKTTSALQQAVHIRHLKPEDRIAVALIDPQGRCLRLQCSYEETSALAGKQIDESGFRELTKVILPKF